MNKKISTPITISIIIVLAVLVWGGVLFYCYRLTPQEVGIVSTEKAGPAKYSYPVQWVQDGKMVDIDYNKDYEISIDSKRLLGGEMPFNCLPLSKYPLLEERDVCSCKDYFSAVKEGFEALNTYSLNQETYFTSYCVVPRYLSNPDIVNSSNISYIRDFVLDDNIFKNLPATVEPIMGMGDKLKTQGLKWSEYNKSIKIDTSEGKGKQGDFRIFAEDEGAYYKISIIARGDFNQDKIEDLLISVGFSVKGGTLSGTEYSILTRLNPKESIINLGEVDMREERDKIIAIDKTADWKTYRNEEIGAEFKYPKEFEYSVENVDNQTSGAGVFSGERITVTFRSDQNKNRIHFTAYTSDYKAFMEDPFTGNTDIDLKCLNILSYNEEGDVCKIIEVAGEKAVFVNEFEGYECSPFLESKVFFTNKGDSIYKGLEFRTLLTDVNEAITRDKKEYCIDDKQWQEVLSGAVSESKNIMENKNLSSQDRNTIIIFNQILSTFRFLD